MSEETNVRVERRAFWWWAYPIFGLFLVNGAAIMSLSVPHGAIAILMGCLCVLLVMLRLNAVHDSCFNQAMLCLLLLVFAVALLLPAVTRNRPAVWRMQCSNNLKSLGIALHNYHGVYRSFPPAVVLDEDGRPMHSWRTLLLPYLEWKPTYDQYRFDEPWDSEANAELSRGSDCESLYLCPSVDAPMEGAANYVAVVGDEAAFLPNGECRSFADFKKGMSETILVLEIATPDRVWSEPRDITIEELVRRLKVDEKGWVHRDAINVLYGDGSVEHLDSSNTMQEIADACLIHEGDHAGLWPDSGAAEERDRRQQIREGWAAFLLNAQLGLFAVIVVMCLLPSRKVHVPADSNSVR